MTNIKMNTYDIIIEDKGLLKLSSYIEDIYDYSMLHIITDENVYNLYHQNIAEALSDFHVSFVVVKPGENAKSLLTYETVIKQLIKNNIRRNHLLIAFGGGVIGDLTGYIASTLYRGIKYVQIPTTLLAQVDSSIGGKVGINLYEGKNLIGSFYNPSFVLIDSTLLKTLSVREYNNGYAEILKAALIGDSSLYNHLLKNRSKLTQQQIIKAIEVKKTLVLEDPFDYGARRHLNFGHTFGHAIEKKHLYKTYKHGEAISYGMLFALEIGVELGETDIGLYEEVKSLLLYTGLVKEPLLKRTSYLDDVIGDKKFVDDIINYVVVPKAGMAKIIKLKRSDLN